MARDSNRSYNRAAQSEADAEARLDAMAEIRFQQSGSQWIGERHQPPQTLIPEFGGR